MRAACVVLAIAALLPGAEGQSGVAKAGLLRSAAGSRSLAEEAGDDNRTLDTTEAAQLWHSVTGSTLSEADEACLDKMFEATAADGNHSVTTDFVIVSAVLMQAHRRCEAVYARAVEALARDGAPRARHTGLSLVEAQKVYDLIKQAASVRGEQAHRRHLQSTGAVVTSAPDGKQACRGAASAVAALADKDLLSVVDVGRVARAALHEAWYGCEPSPHASGHSASGNASLTITFMLLATLPCVACALVAVIMNARCVLLCSVFAFGIGVVSADMVLGLRAGRANAGEMWTDETCPVMLSGYSCSTASLVRSQEWGSKCWSTRCPGVLEMTFLSKSQGAVKVVDATGHVHDVLDGPVYTTRHYNMKDLAVMTSGPQHDLMVSARCLPLSPTSQVVCPLVGEGYGTSGAVDSAKLDTRCWSYFCHGTFVATLVTRLRVGSALNITDGLGRVLDTVEGSTVTTRRYETSGNVTVHLPLVPSVPSPSADVVMMGECRPHTR